MSRSHHYVVNMNRFLTQYATRKTTSTPSLTNLDSNKSADPRQNHKFEVSKKHLKKHDETIKYYKEAHEQN